MSGTDDYEFQRKLSSMTNEGIAKSIKMGLYQEPFLSYAKHELMRRIIDGSISRDKQVISLQIFQIAVAIIALIVAVLAFIKH